MRRPPTLKGPYFLRTGDMEKYSLGPEGATFGD